MICRKNNDCRCFRAISQGGALLLFAVFLGLSTNQFRTQKLALIGNWSPESRSTMDSQTEALITPDEAEAMFFAQSVVFVDARSNSQFIEGHIPGAYNLPQEDLERSLADFVDTHPLDALIVTYCDGEACELSNLAAMTLSDKGYTNVRVFFNGWTIWINRNLPVEIGAAG
jgi:rhodanese-related sulfurtransferase